MGIVHDLTSNFHRWKSHTPVMIFILSDPPSNSELGRPYLGFATSGLSPLAWLKRAGLLLRSLQGFPAAQANKQTSWSTVSPMEPKKLFRMLKYNAEYSRASILSSRRSSIPVPTNMKCRHCLIWDVTVHGNLSEILTSSWKFPCRRLVLTQHSSIVLLSCFEVELTASGWSYSGKALMLLQKALLLSGYN